MKILIHHKVRAWKYIFSLILEENDLDQYINGEVPEPEGDEAKATHKKNLAKAMRIIADSIKDHLIPHVSSFNTLKEVYDALTKMFEGKNINRKMTLRNQLKNVKIHNSKTIQSYFTRVAQIKEQLEAVEEIVEGEIVVTTLNGLPRSWDSFIQGICARRNSISFSQLREECTQEEARLVTREEKMGATEDQDLTVPPRITTRRRRRQRTIITTRRRTRNKRR